MKKKSGTAFPNLGSIKKLWRIMKLTVLISLCFVVSVAANSYSQSAKLSLKLTNATVKDILRQVEAESNFVFLYHIGELDENRKITIDLENAGIHEILDKVLEDQNLKYDIYDRQIIIRSKSQEPVSQNGFQQRAVSGKVSGASGEPLPGVTVVIKGTTVGIITATDGSYHLPNVSGSATLVFSFVGMKTQEIVYEGQSIIDVTMHEETIGLEEVVAIGYGVVKKRDLTGAVSSVKSEEIRMAPVSNAMEALQGRVAGMDIVRTSGKSGSEPAVLLRGNRSLTASNDPLYIIDGIPGSISTLNPNDIQSIEVLKDASSTAIYGSAGANGVIIVTTKQAGKGKVQIDFDAYVGINGFASFPKALQGDAWFDYLEAGYYAANGTNSSNRNDLLTAYSMAPNELNPYIESNKWIDWIDETLHTGTQQNYNLSVRGGNDRTQGYFSLGYNSEKGIYKYDQTDMYTMRAGITHNYSQWLEAGIQTSLNWRDRDTRNSRMNKAFGTIPLGDVYDSSGNINTYPIEGNSTVSLIADDVKGVYVNNSKQIRITANPYIEITPLKGLSFRSRLGTTLLASRTGIFESENSYMNLTGSGSKMKTAEYNTNLEYSYTWENIVNYNFRIADVHEFTLTGISSWNNSQRETGSEYNEGFDYDEFSFFNLNAGNNPKVGSTYSQTKKLSFAGRVNYSLKGRYLLTMSNRWDGASQLANKWDIFPAGALAWRISDEAFMSGTARWLSNLKLRVGYGVTGNANIDPYVTTTMVESSATTLTLGSAQVPVYVLTQAIGNKSLKWEKSYNTNIGVDLGLFDNRVGMSVELYDTDTRDVLYNRPLPTSLGAYSPKLTYNMMSNIARMNNRGVEITLNSGNIETSEFQWNSTLTFAYNKEKVKSIDLGSDIQVEDLIALNLFLGHPKSTVYGYKKLGIWQTNEADEAARYNREPGQIKIETVEKIADDGTSDGGIHEYSAEDKQILGSETPDWTLGFQNSFYWKNFDLNIFMTMRWGQLLNADILGYFKYGKQVNLPATYNYWTPDNPTDDFPQPDLNGNVNDVALASLPVVDGSYLKIRNITLGYTLPDRVRKMIGVTGLRIYGTVSNPFIYTKSKLLKDVDPETGGTDEFPLYKQTVFGINMSF